MAEEYMREHPVCAYCASPIEPCLERASGWKHKIPWNPASGDLRCGGKAKPAEPPIPPTMTAEEREAQRRSFAYGNVTLHNPNVTRELIDKVADEIPPTSAPKHDGSEHFYAENFGMSVGTPAPEPQGEIPEDLVRWYEDAKIPHAAWGASSVRSLIERIGRAESVLRTAREERDKEREITAKLTAQLLAERTAREQAEVKGWNDCVEAAANRAIQYGSTSIAAGIRALSKPSGSQSDNVTDNATK